MINLTAVALVLFGTLLGSIGILLIKKSTDRTLWGMLMARNLWAGVALFGLSTVFYIMALRGEELSVIYPFVSTSYIWTMLFSVKYLGEKFNRWKLASLVGIILGITLIGFGS